MRLYVLEIRRADREIEAAQGGLVGKEPED
jgi:hypothetical protein